MQRFKAKPFGALILTLSFLLPITAYAADDVKQISISMPAQPLNQAVTDLAIQAGLNIGGNSALLANKQAPALNGKYTSEQALTKLLKGSGVTYRFTAANSVTLEKEKLTPAKKIKPAVDKKTAENQPTLLEPVSVTAASISPYEATTASTATGIEASIFDTPRSIQVVQEEIIQEQQAQDLRDVLRNVSGIQTRASAGNTIDRFIVRGLEGNRPFQNGFALAGNGSRVQTANIERVEVLKGPAALLFGQASPGGIINVVTKKPQEQQYNDITAYFDEFGQRRLELDSTGPLNESGTLLYRIVGSIEDSKTFRKTNKHDKISRNLIAPSLTWKIDEHNTLTAGLEWIDSKLPRARGTFLFQDASGDIDIADVPRSRRFGESGDNSDTTQSTLTLDYEHIFNKNWTLDTNFVYQNSNSSTINTNAAAGIGPLFPLPPVTAIIASLATGSPGFVQQNGELVRLTNQFSNDADNYFGAIRLSGDFNWGPVKNNFTSGLDYNRRKSRTSGSQPFLPASEVFIGPLAGTLPFLPAGTIISQLSTINIFNPIYGQSVTALRPVTYGTTTNTQVGLYAQDLITFNEQWKAMFGVRVDRFKRDASSTALISALPGAIGVVAYVPNVTTTDLSLDAIYEASPNVGVVFQPTEQVSIFASYSESFQPNAAIVNLVTGERQQFDPSVGEQYEVGLKGAFLNDKLNFNLAYFNITRENVPAGADPITGKTEITGEENSKGIEFDANIQPLDGLNLLFSYAYIDASPTTGDNKGNQSRGVPRNSASLWAIYHLKGGALKGLSFGGGAVYQGKRFIENDNAFALDAYTTFDAMASYTTAIDATRNLHLQLGVKNLTDKQYYIVGNGGLDIGVGIPRTVYGSLGLEF